ncbi:MAG: hypothetical protein GY775_18860 [Candidatus Scalindua sp.]|nr:hypothetical protein [Candidatus Scalindua sp.]
MEKEKGGNGGIRAKDNAEDKDKETKEREKERHKNRMNRKRKGKGKNQKKEKEKERKEKEREERRAHKEKKDKKGKRKEKGNGRKERRKEKEKEERTRKWRKKKKGKKRKEERGQTNILFVTILPLSVSFLCWSSFVAAREEANQKNAGLTSVDRSTRLLSSLTMPGFRQVIGTQFITSAECNYDSRLSIYLQ